jgi:ComEC/Rec2-related protein
MDDMRNHATKRVRRTARDPPRHTQPPVAWLTWCAVALVVGACLPQGARETVSWSIAHAMARVPRTIGGHTLNIGTPDMHALVATLACACVACGAAALILGAPILRRAVGTLSMSLCLLSCCLLGAAWRQRADDSWNALVRHIAPDSAPRLVEIAGVALKPPSSDERSHLGDAWGDTLSRFTPPSPSSSLDIRIQTPFGPATVRVRVDGHRLPVLAGDRVRATGWVRTLGATTNPGGFDGERWSASRRVAAIMDAESPALVSSEGPDDGIDGTLARWRSCVEDHLQRSMPAWASNAAHALVGASIIGVSWPGASLANDAFAGTGIQHLVAISGFNMGVLAAVALVPLARLRRPRLEGIALILLALVFAASIHTEVSAVRAALMAAGVGAVRLAGLRCSGEAVVAIAAIAIVSADPPQAANPGFQLSFAAVIGLMRASRPLERALMRACTGDGITSVLLRKAIPATSASVAAWSATAPITITHFGQLALWAIPVTIALSPLFAALVVAGSAAPALHALSPPIGSAVGAFAAADAQLLVRMASLATYLPGAIVRTGVTGPDQVDPPGTSHTLRIDSIDVRDGSCHLIRSRDAAILFDAGSLGSATLGSGTVVPALHALGVRRIDAIVVSHANFDHYSAVPEVIDAMSVRRLLVSLDSLERARKSPRGSMAAALRHARDAGCAVVTVGKGDGFAVGRDMHVRVLWPPRTPAVAPSPTAPSPATAGRKRPRGVSENARSVTMLVEIRHEGVDPARAILCGDLSGSACDAVTEQIHHLAGTIAIAEVPHHGSPDPSAVRMLKVLNPSVAIQSTGARRLQRDAIASLLTFMEPFADAPAQSGTAREGSIASGHRTQHDGRAVPRLVTARHGAVAAVIGGDGSLHAGRFDRDRYVWRTLVPASAAARPAHKEQAAVEDEYVPDCSSLPLADLDRQRSVRPRERWVEPEVERERRGRRIEGRPDELTLALLHDNGSMRPGAKPLAHEELAHKPLGPLGDFVDEPYRPPDLQGGEAERGIRVERLRRNGRTRRQLRIRCGLHHWHERRQRHDPGVTCRAEQSPVHLLGREHHETSTRQQRRASKCKCKVAHRLELCAVEDGAIGLPHPNRKPWRRAGDESARRDPVHRNLAALSLLLDDEHLTNALHDTLDHVTVGELHHICGLRHRNRRAALEREASDTVQRRINGTKPKVLPHDAHAAVGIRECAGERSRKALPIGHDHLRQARHGTEGRPSLAPREQCAPIRP